MSARRAAWRLFLALQADDADHVAAKVAHDALKQLMVTPRQIRETALAEVGLQTEFVTEWVAWHLAAINSHLVPDDHAPPARGR